jgi:hypothetical protein
MFRYLPNINGYCYFHINVIHTVWLVSAMIANTINSEIARANQQNLYSKYAHENSSAFSDKYNLIQAILRPIHLAIYRQLSCSISCNFHVQ